LILWKNASIVYINFSAAYILMKVAWCFSFFRILLMESTKPLKSTKTMKVLLERLSTSLLNKSRGTTKESRKGIIMDYNPQILALLGNRIDLLHFIAG